MNGAEELPAGPRLLALAGELVRLQPSRTDPEAYLVSKDRIVTELRRVARQVDYRPRAAFTAYAVIATSPRARSLSNEAAKINTPSMAPFRRDVSATETIVDRSPHCRHCRRRQAAQRRKRLQLGTGDLFDWANGRLLDHSEIQQAAGD
jgi:hypothetical protein